jgi:hypothetical protein
MSGLMKQERLKVDNFNGFTFVTMKGGWMLSLRYCTSLETGKVNERKGKGFYWVRLLKGPIIGNRQRGAGENLKR